MSPASLLLKMTVRTEELAKLKAHRWQVSCLEFRADGFMLATAGWDKEVHIWDMINLEVVNTLKGVHKVPITSLSWQGERGEVLCTGSADHTAVLWSPDTGAHLQTLTGHSGWVLGVCFSSSGSLLATASWDKSVRIWDAYTGQHINSYTDHSGGVWSVAFHPRSSGVLCSASEDGSVKVWDLREGKVTQDFTVGHSDAVYCARWSPDGTMIASGSADTKVCIWDIDTGLLANTIYGHSDTVKSLAFNPNTDTAIPVLASAGDCTLLLSDPRPTQKAGLLSLSPHTPGKEVEAVSISPDGSLVVSGGRDGLLALLTLSVPLLNPQNHDDSVSSKLRNSHTILDHSFDMNDSTEDLVEVISQASTSEGDLSVTASRENVSPESAARERSKQNHLTKTTEHQHKMEHSARISRQKRAEKKVVDLPTMIAHLSASVRGSLLEEQASSSDSEDEETYTQRKISNLIGVSQKVDKFSQITKKTSVQETRHKAPAPRLSLLPDKAIETVKENRKFFESIEALDIDGEYGRENLIETDYYDGYSSLLPGEESDESPMQSGHYALQVKDLNKFPPPFLQATGSEDDDDDEDVPFSMI